MCCSGAIELRCVNDALEPTNCANGCTPDVGCNGQAPIGFRCDNVTLPNGFRLPAGRHGPAALLFRRLQLPKETSVLKGRLPNVVCAAQRLGWEGNESTHVIDVDCSGTRNRRVETRATPITQCLPERGG